MAAKERKERKKKGLRMDPVVAQVRDYGGEAANRHE
jgi:hypothetical protein